MRPAARYIAAGVVTAALGAAPGIAAAQSTSPSSTSTPPASTQGAPTTGSSTQSTQPPSGTSTSGSTSPSDATSTGVDEAAAREHLSQARQGLAELTKLPAAAQLQGEQRTSVSNVIQAFNGLATATTDWRPKFKAVNDQLNAILGAGTTGADATGTSGTTPSATPSSPTGAGDSSATGSATGAAGATSGGYDPTIVSKLREVKMHLDAFQEASGDPTPHFDAIDGIVDGALNGSAGASSVGTTGTTGSATGTSGDAAGAVSISRAQLEEIKQHVAKLRAASEAAAARRP